MQDILWLDETTSTNEDARRFAKEGAPALFCVAAGSQSAGRGRLGRSFYSPYGLGLYLSMVLRPAAHSADSQLISVAAGIAVCDAVSSVCGVKTGLKWPNDVQIDGRKLCGILAESAVSPSGMMDYAVLGVGINLNHGPEDFPPEIRDTALSLKMEAGMTFDIRAFADVIRDELAYWFTGDRFLAEKHTLLTRYRALLCMLGREISLTGPSGTEQGTALDVDDSANLLVRRPDGSVLTVGAGEITLRR